MPPAGTSATGKILPNSFWYGLETVLEAIVFLGTSVLVARYLGPDILGHFAFINFFVLTVTRASGSGVTSATRKYMSEYLAQNKPGMARGIYHLAYRYQLTSSLTLAALGLVAVILFGEHGYKLMASIMVISIVPGLMSWVPAQANNAFENVAPNTIRALGYLVVYAAGLLLTLHVHWALVGVASAQLVARTVEVFLRTIPLQKTLHAMPLDQLDDALVRRIRKYCVEALGIQLLLSLVWDRSEILFLQHYSTYVQIGFYSGSFGLTNNLLLVPKAFGGATGVTLMVEAGRDPAKVDSIVRAASRFLLLVVFPVHLGAAAVTALAMRYAYGARYLPAVPVLVIAAILAMSRAFQDIPETLLRAADKQKRILGLLLVTGAVNLTLDYIFIRHYAAVGAAIANGLAQTFGIFAFWHQTRKLYRFRFPFATAFRLAAAGTLMAATSYAICRLLPNPAGLVLAIAAGVPLYILLVRLFHGLEPSDRSRLARIGSRLPASVRTVYDRAIEFVTPSASAEANAPVVS